ncbi:MAG: hypothetical protein U5L45_07615 [Saprospiraceae bacterium]|nr:hypothetical protein [Saprospiraceae bacterium]
MAFTYLETLEDATKTVEQFESATLPDWAWTHEAHLICALSVLSRFGMEQAPVAMRERIMKYNIAVGKINSDTSGYHETVTIFWLKAIWERLSVENKVTFDQATLDALLSNIDLAYRNLFLKSYSEKRILSTEARKKYVKPDLEDVTFLSCRQPL